MAFEPREPPDVVGMQPSATPNSVAFWSSMLGCLRKATDIFATGCARSHPGVVNRSLAKISSKEDDLGMGYLHRQHQGPFPGRRYG